MAQPRDERQSRERSDIEQRTRSERETAARSRGPSNRGELSRRGLPLSRYPGDPFAVMDELHREIDRMFENFGLGGRLIRSPLLGRPLDRFEAGDLERPLWSPQIEVYEKDGKMHVCADLPGLERKDVHVEVNDDVLTIEGERHSEQRDQSGDWSERSYGRFFRSIPLPDGVDAEKIVAKFENGVLDVAFDAPRREKPRGRQVEIR